MLATRCQWQGAGTKGVPGLMPRGVAGGAGFGVVSGLVSGREGIQ